MEQYHPKLGKKDSTLLFLFSGTGNSLNVAIRLQEKIENCEILSIPRVFEENRLNYEAARIGFIFPVFFTDAPNIVKEFLKNINISGNPYLFAIATCGGEVGKTFRTINKLFDKQNRKLHFEFSLVLPSNFIILTDKTNTQEEIDKIIKDSEVRINEIIEKITNRENEKFTPTKVSFSNKFTNWMGKLFLFQIFSDRGFKIDDEKCIRCGTCVSVCPMNNIKIVNKVTWNHNCELCLACIHWCPKNAIEHFKTHGIPRYHHPDITIKQMKTYKSKS
jgi:ferredoxin/flavodoxin